MNFNNLTLRLEKKQDYRAVEALTREAFWNHFVPGCDEHYLAHTLREAAAFIPELCYVAEVDGKLAGNIMYAHAHVLLDAGGVLPVLTFGPLSVLPAYQRQGIGRRLVEHTRTLAAEMGHSAIFIYGHPQVYSHMGFEPAERYGIASSENMYHDALQVYVLREGALDAAAGRFIEGDAYAAMDEKDVAAFDSGFPPREKQAGLPSQQHFLESSNRFRPR